MWSSDRLIFSSFAFCHLKARIFFFFLFYSSSLLYSRVTLCVKTIVQSLSWNRKKRKKFFQFISLSPDERFFSPRTSYKLHFRSGICFNLGGFVLVALVTLCVLSSHNKHLQVASCIHFSLLPLLPSSVSPW